MSSIKYGWLLRVHAKSKEDAESRTVRVVEMVSAIRAVSGGPIVVAIPYNRDFGKTGMILLREVRNKGVRVINFNGSPNTDVLNSGLQKLQSLGCTHAVIVSNKSVSAITANTMSDIGRALVVGAKAVGVAFDELAGLVRQGVMQNTFAVWELESAIKSGGFRFEHPALGGVEEISLSLGLIDKYGECLAVVNDKYSRLNIHETKEAQSHYRDSLHSKHERVEFLLSREGRTLQDLSGAVMFYR